MYYTCERCLATILLLIHGFMPPHCFCQQLNVKARFKERITERPEPVTTGIKLLLSNTTEITAVNDVRKTSDMYTGLILCIKVQ